MIMLGQGSGDLTALTTHKSAQTPGPDCDFLHPKFLEKIQRLVVLTERRIKVLVFGRILFPVRMWDQQPFREKPVLQGVPCHCSLSDLCSGAGGLRGIAAIGFDFSGRDSSFSTRSRGDFLPRLSCLVSIVVCRQFARSV